MKLRIDPTNPNTFRRMVKQGRGKGRGEEYKPWLTVQDLSSKGESTRMSGWRTGRRLVHLFSKLERNFFYTIEWERNVVDYREQFPLELADTVKIATENGWRHPVSPQSGRYWPMTTDLLVTKLVNGHEVHFAKSVKPHSGVELLGSLHPRHVRNNWVKFNIEFEYWRRREVKLCWVTERDFNQVLALNVKGVHGFFHLESLHPLTDKDVAPVADEILRRASTGTESLARAGYAVDEKFGLQPGKSICVALHKIANRSWNVDFSVPFKTDKPLNLCQK